MEIWKRWADHYRNLGFNAEHICRDGILNEGEFNSASPRVLFVLKETDDAAGLDLRDHLRNGPVFQMWHTVARWAVGILENFPEYNGINGDQMKQSLSKVACINLKKLTGGAAANLSVVGAFALRDRHLLREQIKDIIRPNIIVGCGTFEILAWLLELDVDPMEPFAKAVYSKDYSAWVIPSRHPNRASVTAYDDLKKFIQGMRR